MVDIVAGNNISNPQTNPIGTNTGCLLSGETKPSWYIFKICNTGLFEILIGSVINQYQQGGYYDWSIWKYTSTSCTKIFNNQLAPLRCNWNAITSGGTGIKDTLNLPNGGFKGNYEPPLPVNTGDSLVICINNYSGINYFIDFISVGTSSISNCPITTVVPTHEIAKQRALFYNNSLNQIELLDLTITCVTIHTIEGKEIYRSKTPGHLIDCSGFNKSVYFISFLRENNLPTTEKIIID